MERAANPLHWRLQHTDCALTGPEDWRQLRGCAYIKQLSISSAANIYIYFYPKMLQQNVETRAALLAGAALFIEGICVCRSDGTGAFWGKDWRFDPFTGKGTSLLSSTRAWRSTCPWGYEQAPLLLLALETRLLAGGSQSLLFWANPAQLRGCAMLCSALSSKKKGLIAGTVTKANEMQIELQRSVGNRELVCQHLKGSECSQGVWAAPAQVSCVPEGSGPRNCPPRAVPAWQAAGSAASLWPSSQRLNTLQ